MERVLKVTGKGKISVKPDTIRLNIEATKLCNEYTDAVKTSAEDTGILRKTLEGIGFDPTELKTTYFNIDSEYEWQGRHANKKKLVGYRYIHRLYIQFPNDNERLGKILYALANCKIKVEFNIRHTVKDVEAVKNELLGKAIEDSKIKADVLSRSSGVSLGEIKTIDYSWQEVEVYTKPVRNLYLAESITSYLERSSDSYDIDIEADNIEVEDTVTVIWEIKS